MAYARITTPDPAFDPKKPVYINGFLFKPDLPAPVLGRDYFCPAPSEEEMEYHRRMGTVSDDRDYGESPS